MIREILWWANIIENIAMTAIQFAVLSLMNDFERKTMNPLDAAKELQGTVKPTIALFIGGCLLPLFNFRYLCYLLIIQIIIGFGVYKYSGTASWFEPRYLYRDSKTIKIRHAIIILGNTIMGLYGLIAFFVARS